MKIRPSALSVKCSEQASTRRQIVNSLTPAARAASTTIAIPTSAPHLLHHEAGLSSRLRKMNVRSVSTVNFMMRFSYFTRSP